MPGNGGKLPRKQEEALAALLAEPTIARAAARAGVSERTLHNWLADAQFLAAYRAARRAVVEGTIARLQKAANAAYRTLRRNLTCGTPAVEVKAATVILDKAAAGVELLDLESRLVALEADAARRNKR